MVLLLLVVLMRKQTGLWDLSKAGAELAFGNGVCSFIQVRNACILIPGRLTFSLLGELVTAVWMASIFGCK